MSEDRKVIEFPQPRRRHKEMTGDERYAADVFSAYRSLIRKIDKARAVGLTVEFDASRPRITKVYK